MNAPDLHQAPPLLQARGLCFSRNEQPVFGPLDFAVGVGEALLVHGDNGSGKSTLLRVLAGLLPAGAGEITIDGQPADRDAIARSAHLLGHQLGLKGELGCMHNLRFAMALFGRRRGASPNAALESVGLDGYQDSEARQLSAGQRKRLGLARLLLVPARLWLLDEPYANLDLEGITLVNRLVERHLGSGGSALITSHGAYATPAVRSRVLELSPLPGAGAAA